jgi:2'-5' RNA ligase
MRTFIAVRIPVTDPISSVIRQLQTMRPALKVVSDDQLHVTLKFLGETDDSVVPRLGSLLHAIAATEAACEMNLTGLGAFPQVSRPNVVWAGFVDSGPLVRLASSLESRCEALGFPREARPFRPHLTLARTKAAPPESLPEFIRDRGNTWFGTVGIRALDLYRSDLQPAGPTYTSLLSVPLREL